MKKLFILFPIASLIVVACMIHYVNRSKIDLYIIKDSLIQTNKKITSSINEKYSINNQFMINNNFLRV